MNGKKNPVDKSILENGRSYRLPPLMCKKEQSVGDLRPEWPDPPTDCFFLFSSLNERQDLDPAITDIICLPNARVYFQSASLSATGHGFPGTDLSGKRAGFQKIPERLKEDLDGAPPRSNAPDYAACSFSSGPVCPTG